MTIAEKLQTIADNEQRVYDAGYNAGKAEGGGTEEVEITISNTLGEPVNIYFYNHLDEAMDMYDIAANGGTKLIMPKNSMIAVESMGASFRGYTPEGEAVTFLHTDEQWNFIACDRTQTVVLCEI